MLQKIFQQVTAEHLEMLLNVFNAASAKVDKYIALKVGNRASTF